MKNRMVIWVKYLLRKKFRVRVKHFSEGLYMVQYCHYRVIPFWYSLKYWFEQGPPGGTETWSTDLWSYTEAEKVAVKMKSIKDIDAYYKPLEEQELKWLEDENKFWEKNVPYKTKYI